VILAVAQHLFGKRMRCGTFYSERRFFYLAAWLPAPDYRGSASNDALKTGKVVRERLA
jgi:hypothetical protein